MPNVEIERWRAMALQLRQAAELQDWERVQRLDARLAQWLQTTSAIAMGAAERESLQQVQAAHTHVLAQCRQAKAEAAQQLQRLQNQQEAQKAYAWQETLE